MDDGFESKIRLDVLDVLWIACVENGVNFFDHGLNVCRAIRRHMFPDRLEVFPEVTAGEIIVNGALTGTKETHAMASTTPDDEYPA